MSSSSIHIQKVNAGSFLHNDRTIKVSYLIDSSNKNECSTPSTVAIKRFNELKAIAMKNYTERTHQKMQKNTIFLKEAIVNLQEHHTLKDLEPIKKKLEDYGFTVLQMSIHRDEGFLNKDNKKEKNFHAHITMLNLDTATGRTVKFGKHYRSELSKLQTFVAKTLKMKRGKVSVKEEAKRLKVRVSKSTRRLDTHDYKRAMQIKEKELELQEQEQYNFREYQKKITALENLTSEQKKELHRLNSAAKKDAEKIAELREELEKQKRLNDELEQEKNAIDQEKNAKYNQVKIFNKIFTKIAQEFDVETKSYGQIRDDVISKYISAKQEVLELKKTIETLQAEKSDLEQEIKFAEHRESEMQSFRFNYYSSSRRSHELQKKLNDAEKTIETLQEEKRDLIAKYKELKDAFTEVAQAIGIKFVTVKQVIADIVSKFKTAKQTETAKEPEPVSDDEIQRKYQQMAENAYKEKQRFPKLR